MFIIYCIVEGGRIEQGEKWEEYCESLLYAALDLSSKLFD